jgi:PKD repeat protein
MKLSSFASRWALACLACCTFLAVPAHAQGGRHFGRGAPNALGELPTGAFRSALDQLPGPARGRALGILRRLEFGERDLPFLRVDRAGGVFYEDPIAEEAEEAGEPGSVLEEVTFAEAFALHSKPGASRTVYLDMDGHVVSGTIWNGSADPLHMRPYDTNGDDGVFTQGELDDIAEVWKRVAEDFAPYDIDVTTEEPESFGPNVGQILVTRKADQFGNPIYSCNCGGVAYVGVWGNSNYPYYQPALVFLDGVGGPHNISEAASHELGHNLNLSHDGATGTSYYSGHGSGYTDWGPIMGVGYSAQVTQWSQGEYAGANNPQDDLDIIRSYLSYRVDDHEDVDFGFATPLTIHNGVDVFSTNPVTDPANLDPANKGIIEDRSDVDLFYFDSGPGAVDLSVTPAWINAFASHSRRGMNVDIEATLYDEFGGFVAQSNPADDTYARIVASVDGGRYVLAVDGIGVGDPSTGYSDYGSIGQYFIDGSVPEDTVSALPPLAPSDLQASLSGEVNILLVWTDPGSTPESNETAYRILRQIDGGAFVQLAERPRDSESFSDNNLSAGLYSYRVEVYNATGSDASNATSPIEIQVPSVAHATGETSMDGEILGGTYLDTTSAAGFERVAERHQGGKPSQRVSKLEHVWTVTGVSDAADVTLEVDAEAPNAISGDSFEFSYALNGGPYTPFDVLDSGQGRRILTAHLAQPVSGSVNVRVRDTNRAAGDRDTDALDVHLIEVRSSGDAGDLSPGVTISEPSDGFSALEGTAIVFAATADDPEDGDLSAEIAWSSDVDGSIGNGPSIAVSALSVGFHTISAQVADSAANPGSDSIGVEILAPAGNSAPTAEFTQTTSGLTASFSDASSDSDGSVVSWSWEFGDGGSSSAQHPGHAYAAPGVYSVTLIATDNEGASSAPRTHDVSVSDPGAGPSIQGIAPNAMSSGATIGVTISGSGFAAGAALTFVNGSGPIPVASNVSVTPSSISASVYVKRGGPRRLRTWDVLVTHPDGSADTLVGGFTVNP